jgi:hypothetical protein
MVTPMLLLDKVGIWTKPDIQSIGISGFVPTRNGVGALMSESFQMESLMLKEPKAMWTNLYLEEIGYMSDYVTDLVLKSGSNSRFSHIASSGRLNRGT